MNTLELIGNTPMMQVPGENIFVKLEKFNPGGSIKDRTALGLMMDAQKRGVLNADSIILEPTSGNTGIGLALVGKRMGYSVAIVMPDSMSLERRQLIAAYGATLILTDGKEGMAGAIAKAEELSASDRRYFIPDQFNNPAGAEIHYHTTGVELIRDVPDLDIFVAAVGTGGTFSGVSRRLKKTRPWVMTVAVEPAASPVLAGGMAAPHGIQGIGANFIPGVYEENLADDLIHISDQAAIDTAVEFSRKTGVLVGISSGANIAAARKLADKYGKEKKIVTIAPDGGEKYFSVVNYGGGEASCI